MAWYCISFGLIARYHTVIYRCYSAPANYRVVHLVIFHKSKNQQVNTQEITCQTCRQRLQTSSKLGNWRNTSALPPPSSSSPRSSFGFGKREKLCLWPIIQQVVVFRQYCTLCFFAFYCSSQSYVCICLLVTCKETGKEIMYCPQEKQLF